MLHSIIRRGLMTMLMGLALCSLQSYAASRILFTTALPVGSTITLTLSADGAVTAQGLAGSILADGKAHAYTIESAEVKLSGAITAITLSHQKLSALDKRAHGATLCGQQPHGAKPFLCQRTPASRLHFQSARATQHTQSFCPQGATPQGQLRQEP